MSQHAVLKRGADGIHRGIIDGREVEMDTRGWICRRFTADGAGRLVESAAPDGWAIDDELVVSCDGDQWTLVQGGKQVCMTSDDAADLLWRASSEGEP